MASSTSGAPISQATALPSLSSKAAPLYFRAEEKGSVSVHRHPPSPSSGAGYASMIAWRLALGFGSEAPSAPSTRPAYSSPVPLSVRTSRTSMPPSVRVPVLSRQTTSTRARPSMAGSSWTRHCLRPSRMTPMAKATDVSRTSPSGTMGTIPATMRRMAALTSLCSTTSWLRMRPTAAGIIIQVMYLRIWLMPLRSSEWTSVKRLASSASCAA